MPKNTERSEKTAIIKASELLQNTHDRFVCDEETRETLVGIIGLYTSGNSKVVSSFLQSPSIDVAMISPSSTVRTRNTDPVDMWRGVFV